MKLVLTVMVRDEIDIIAPMIEHHLDQGVDLIIATDNGSVDGTTEVLQAYADLGVVELHHDPVHRKQQHAVVTGMARRARTEHAADWVLNADADEFWTAKNRTLTLREALLRIPSSLNAFTVPVVNLVGPPAVRGPGFERLLWRDNRSAEQLRDVGINAQPTPNAVHRGHPDVVVAQGNHFVSLESSGQPDPAYELEVLHLPWRSWTQLEQKVIHAGLAYEASENLRPSKNHHGRADYGRFKAGRLFEAFMLRQPIADEIASAEAEGWLLKDPWLSNHLQDLVQRAVRPDLLRAALSADDEPIEPATHRAAAELGRKFIAIEVERDEARKLADEKARTAQRISRQRQAARAQAAKAAEELKAVTRQRDVARKRLRRTRVELNTLKKQGAMVSGSPKKPKGLRRTVRLTVKRARGQAARSLRGLRPGRADRSPNEGRASAPVSDAQHVGNATNAQPAPVERAVPRRRRKNQGPRPRPNPDVQLLSSSALFDLDWYVVQRGSSLPRGAAVRDYLKRGQSMGWTPHPLFDPDYFAQAYADEIGEQHPFVAYLTTPSYRCAPTHELFDVASYVAAFPEAEHHPGGPLAHYGEVGASRGARPNEWYDPDPVSQPDGLLGWIRERHEEWRQRSEAVVPRFTPRRPVPPDGASSSPPEEPPATQGHGSPAVSVIVTVQEARERFDEVVASIVAQTFTDWELIVVADDSIQVTSLEGLEGDRRVAVVEAPKASVGGARNAGLAVATGRFVAWMDGEATWRPNHLKAILDTLSTEGGRAAYDVVEKTIGPADAGQKLFAVGHATRGQLEVASLIDVNALLVERQLAVEIGGFDELLPGSTAYDFVLKISSEEPLRHVPHVGVQLLRGRPPAIRFPLRADACDNAVLNNHLVDWASLANGDASSVTVSIIIPTPNDWRLTTAAVSSIARAAASSEVTAETIIVDNGSKATAAAILDSLPLRFSDVRVVHSPTNRGFALGNNIAMAHARGDIIVFLNNDTEVAPGWLEPLVSSLTDPDVLGAQSLLLYPSGSIQSAGVAFPSCGGLPHMLLRGYPVEDARHLDRAEFAALTGAALAVRRSDVVTLQGFDPLFLNGMEDVDFGLRLRARRAGVFRVCPESIVIHHESRSPGRYDRSVTNRRLLLDRWNGAMPGDDVRLWGLAGFDVVGYDPKSRVSEDRRLDVPHPVLVRRGGVSVVERPRRMRWAIKNPAPAGEEGEKWGDTHFARRLAEALRSEGQEVVIDHRGEYDRVTGHHDDVVLVLRGVARYTPRYGQVSMMWVISHPSWLQAPEIASYDRVFAASATWAERASQRFGLRVEPLLQATDPARFHPDLTPPDSGYPCLFVGGSRKILRPIVGQAIDIGMPLTVFGSEWEGLIPDSYVAGQYLPNDRLGAAYRAAGVVLNDHWDDMREEGFVSNRLFDAVASGARVITDDVNGLGDTFGSSVQVVRDEEDLRRIFAAEDLDSIFGDDEERRRNAKRVAAEHSFEVRARSLVMAAIDAFAEQSDTRRAVAQ